MSRSKCAIDESDVDTCRKIVRVGEPEQVPQHGACIPEQVPVAALAVLPLGAERDTGQHETARSRADRRCGGRSGERPAVVVHLDRVQVAGRHRGAEPSRVAATGRVAHPRDPGGEEQEP